MEILKQEIWVIKWHNELLSYFRVGGGSSSRDRVAKFSVDLSGGIIRVEHYNHTIAAAVAAFIISDIAEVLDIKLKLNLLFNPPPTNTTTRHLHHTLIQQQN